MPQKGSLTRSIVAILGIFLSWFALGVLFYQESPQDTPTIVHLFTSLK